MEVPMTKTYVVQMTKVPSAGGGWFDLFNGQYETLSKARRKAEDRRRKNELSHLSQIRLCRVRIIERVETEVE